MNIDLMKRVRKEREWTLEDLAAALTKAGMPTTKATLGYWEAGETEPTLPRARALAEVLGVSLEDLAGDSANVSA